MLCALALSPMANGAIIFDVDSDRTLAGHGGTQFFADVFLAVDGADIGVQSQRWVARVEVTARDGGALTDLTLGTAANPIAPDPYPGNPTNANGSNVHPYIMQHDGLDGDGNALVAALEARTNLFRIPITVLPTAPVGAKFDFNITTHSVSPGLLPQTGVYGLFTAGQPSLNATFDAANPEFTLTVIPEPSTVTASILALAAVGFVGYRRRKSATAQPEVAG
jgi:hypothetical protein